MSVIRFLSAALIELGLYLWYIPETCYDIGMVSVREKKFIWDMEADEIERSLYEGDR